MKTIIRINRLPATQYCVEVHTGGRDGVGQGDGTGIYETYAEALAVMAAAKVSGNGATCIARNRRGEGRVLRIALVAALGK